MRPSFSRSVISTVLAYGKTLRAQHPRLLRWLAATAGIAVVSAVIGSVPLKSITSVSLPPVQLSSDPLYQRGVAAKPTLTLALSVEYPTVGAAYVNKDNASLDDTFDPSKAYLGYFDYRSCYVYDTTKGYFTRSKAADGSDHTCGGDSYSGNFMNWASTSAIDILRMGLTGGDRVIDDAQITVLQRATLPDSNHTNYTEPFYNSQYFPAKKIKAGSSALSGVLPASVLNGYGGDVYIANCLNQVFIGKASEGSCEAPANNASIATLNARVAVCGDAAEAASRESYRPGYCTRYPNGNYKPVGNLQQYSDRVRVAVFGYLLSNTTARYGGVLRAPMSYLGQKAFDENYSALSAGNPFAEWDANTGVFKKDARQSGFEYSGAVNYINRFGRSGVYERYDAVSELYYESLRYLQGLPPTSQAAAGVNAAVSVDPLDLKDGFPVYNTVTSPASAQQGWVDPHPRGDKFTDYSCVKNNIVTIGDVHTWADKSIPGNTRTSSNDFARNASDAANEPDFRFWTSVVGRFESASGVSYVDGAGITQNTATPANPTPLALGNIEDTSPSTGNSSSYYLAGMAYWAHTHDIRPTTNWTDGATKGRPGMRVTTYTIDVNERADQTLLAAHQRNQYFLAAKYGGFSDYSTKKNSLGASVTADQGNPFVLQPDDVGKTPPVDPNNSWQRAGQAGEARNYYLGNEAIAMLAALDTIFRDVTKNTGNVAGIAVDSRRVAETQAVYQGRFDPDNWHGDVVAYRLSDVGTSGFDVTKAIWSAADQLDKRTADRKIVVGTRSGGSTSALDFTWDAILGNPDYVTAFRTSPDDATGQTLDSLDVAKSRVNYLRGDRSKESPTGLRPRPASRGLLGDVVNSGVTFMGQPTRSISDASYQAFFNAHQGRTKLVYAGANDGMLHAFNAATGNEVFAYIPSWLVPKLNLLTSTKYGHESYVDATPTVAEANLGSTDTPDWRTVLVGGTGAGGQGVYALDVTDPDSNFTTRNVLWEFTDADDPDLGNVVGRPRVLKLKVDGAYKWFAVFGGGVNNYVDDGHATDSGGDAFIFLLDLGKKPSEGWSKGNNYYKIRLPKIDSATVASGVLNLSVVTNADRAVVSIYAGDLHGQLWKINVDKSLDSSIDLNKLQPQLLFKAARNGKPQPISSAPALFRVEGRIVVVFATGKFLEPSDKEMVDGAFPVQSTYAVYDGSTTIPRTLTSDDLKKIDVLADKWDGANFAWGIPSSSGGAQVYAGWYFDFPSGASTGERETGLMLALPGTVIFNSIMPADNSCSTGGGASYMLSLFTGGGSRVVLTDMLSDPIALEGDLVSDALNDRSSNGTKNVTIKNCTTDSCTDRDVSISRRLNRISWRELANFEEIRNRKASP
jgi:type IV pilus assembly protein PilY1